MPRTSASTSPEVLETRSSADLGSSIDQAEVLTGRAFLEQVSTTTDHLAVSDDGHLLVERCDAVDLVAEYGSPLFVLSESTLRDNAERVRVAFSKRWPTQVNVMFAIKANNNLAVRRIMTDVGLGGDCFSSGEIYATFAGGADPRKVALNGSNKSPGAIAEAIARGMVINLDSLEELQLVETTAAELAMNASVTIRVRLDSASYDAARAVDQELPDIRHFIDTEQVGSSAEAAERLLMTALGSDAVDVLGYHFHLGRLSRLPAYHRWWSAGLARLIRDLRDRTGFTPRLLNTGGGYAREREPESGTAPLMNPWTIEEYAETVTTELLTAFDDPTSPPPELWIEPGRYIAGNAGVLLSRVGTVKADVGMVWINVDASINDLPRVDNAGWDYVALPASDMDAPPGPPADVVGSLCVGRHLKVQTPLPEMTRGAVVAFLDTGAYAETASTQYNAVPRPATVLVRGGTSWLIKRRETIEDLFDRHSIPPHLADSTAAAREPVRSRT